VKARLDHIGIAVSNLDAALAFYRDALGLEIEPPEEVPSQQVRAHFVPVGEPALELLEATSSDSAIARYLERHGPGIHHITLRVDDIRAALVRLKEKGVRLVDQEPRTGAEGALVAFVHPSAAHGVLVELKQAAAHSGFTAPSRYTLGQLELITLADGFLRLDGGAMFGVVPRVLWERRIRPDEKNRITLGLRPLVVRGERTVLIDAGCGNKMDARQAEIYGRDRVVTLEQSLAAVGLAPSDIELVVATHLHFDHAGGFTTRDNDGHVVPAFPNARYIVHRGEWDDAIHPHERNRASYSPDDFLPLARAGVLDLVGDDALVMEGMTLRRSGGHTQHHHVVTIQSRGETAVFVADMYPTTAHVPEAWLMGYDLYPMETLAFKRMFAREAIEREYLLFFEHDPGLAAGRLRNVDGKRRVETVL
jgi:methylmalonyl-CoA epimerase